MSKDLTLTDDVILSPVVAVLNEEDGLAIVAMKESLADTWNIKQIFRTDTEMRVSVLNDNSFPDNSSKYWQVVREQNMQFEQVMLASFSMRRLQLNQLEITDKMEGATGIELARLQIDLDENLFAIANLTQQIKDRVRELKLWETLKQELNDGTFNTKDVNANQMDSLEKQLTNRMMHLTPGTDPNEVSNIMGPLKTLKKYKENYLIDLPIK
jgi:hypothetical protein